MVQLPFLEVLLSVVFIFFILCLAVSGIVEFWRKLYKKRSKTLYLALEKVLNDPQNKNWNDLFYNHPQIETFRKSLKSYPAYISPAAFSSALIDLIAEEGSGSRVVQDEKGHVKFEGDGLGTDTFLKYKKGLEALNHSSFKRLLLSLLNDAKDTSTAKRNIANWFSSYMDTVTGWYKWSARRTTLKVAIIITILFNIDSLAIIDKLNKDKQLSHSIAENASQFTQNANNLGITADSMKIGQLMQEDGKIAIVLVADSNLEVPAAKPYNNELAEARKQMEQLDNFFAANNLPFGWETRAELGVDEDVSFWELIEIYWSNLSMFQLLGWLITIIALTFGAPFWFDVMSKFVNVRNTGLKPGYAKTQE